MRDHYMFPVYKIRENYGSLVSSRLLPLKIDESEDEDEPDEDEDFDEDWEDEEEE